MNYIIEDKQKFKQYREVFRSRSRNKQATILDHVLYNIVRGKHITHGFTPITNQKKLSSDRHQRKWLAVILAINTFKWHISSRAAYLSRSENEYYAASPVVVYDEVIETEQWRAIKEVLEDYQEKCDDI